MRLETKGINGNLMRPILVNASKSKLRDDSNTSWNNLRSNSIFESMHLVKAHQQ